MRLVRDRNVALVVSGHVHQHRRLDFDGVAHVWAPTTWAVLPDEVQPTLGSRRCGLVTLDLAADHPLDADIVEPDGLTHLLRTSRSHTGSDPAQPAAIAEPHRHIERGDPLGRASKSK